LITRDKQKQWRDTFSFSLSGGQNNPGSQNTVLIQHSNSIFSFPLTPQVAWSVSRCHSGPQPLKEQVKKGL